jgi:NTE family protein
VKSLFVFFLLLTFVGANERPKIALVLSGGGARGAAHVGVLKVLQEKKIPIDLIVGTSMGSFIGGLYASGKTPSQIEKMLISTNWNDYIQADFNRQDIPMRKKQNEYTYQGKLGMGVDIKNRLVLPTGVLKRQPLLYKFLKETQHVQSIHNFDDFPIPFRAVATNIKNGDAVVLKSGSLAKAIYASSSIPGGFQPICIDGIDLVDGGVSNNIPISVAKEMGADIIIAVDVSEDFSEELEVNSYFVVMNQLVNILMRKNANTSIATLTDKDILITSDLKGYSGLDVDQYASIISKGYESALKVDNKLKSLSLSDEEYKNYKEKYRAKTKYKKNIIDKIEINNPTYISDNSILRRLHVHVGDTLDEDLIRADLLHIYNTMMFDSVEYVLKKENGQNILVITTAPAWDNHGEIRFALGLEDDFHGHSNYSLKVGYTMFGLNEYGGEWKNDFAIGKRKKAYTEIFQPFDAMQRYYIKPSVVYSSWVDVIPASAMGNPSNGNYELGVERYGGTFVFGAHIGTDYEFETGVSSFHDSLEIQLLNDIRNYNAKPMYVSINVDNLDNIHFPKVGVKSKLIWTKELRELKSDYDYEQVYFELEKPLTLWFNNVTTYVKYGNTYKSDITAIAGNFNLGGLFNLSGYVPYSLNGSNMLLGVLRYRYQLKDGGFFGALNTPLYVGFSAEIGNTWDKGHNVSYDIMKKSTTVYAAADTILGPFYLAYGFSEAGEQTFYLYLGEKF